MFKQRRHDLVIMTWLLGHLRGPVIFAALPDIACLVRDKFVSALQGDKAYLPAQRPRQVA